MKVILAIDAVFKRKSRKFLTAYLEILADMNNVILIKYTQIIYHMKALLLYVLNMQENSRF